MYRPLPDSHDRSALDRLTWRGILVGYATVAAFPLLLWVVSRPVAGTAAVATILGLITGARRAHRLVRCFYDCRVVTFDLAGDVRITVGQVPRDDPN